MKFRKEVFYIYSYKNGRRDRNVGFATVKIKSNQCRLMVSLKTPEGYLAEKVQICLYKKEGTKLLGFNLGYLQPLSNISRFKTEIDVSRLKEAGFSVDEMSGVYLYSSEHSGFVFNADMEADDIDMTPQFLCDSQLQCVM